MKDSKTTRANANKKKPEVKVTKVTPTEENFLDDNEDKRLIIFIAAAILVVVGTAIGLLVGLGNGKEEEPPKKNDNKNIVEPVDNSKVTEKEEDKIEGVKTEEVVRKVTAVVESNSDLNDDEEEEEENNGIGDGGETHTVTYIYYPDVDEMEPESKEVEVDDNGFAVEITPVGYSDCEFMADEEGTEAFNFEIPITEAATVHAFCHLITYTIDYDLGNPGNPDTYTVRDPETELNPALGDAPFDGWYTDPEYTNLVTSLTPSIADYANDEHEIYLYGKYGEIEECLDGGCEVCDGPECTEPGSDAGTTDPGTDAGTTKPGSDAGTTEPGTDAGTTEPGTDAGTTEPGTDAGTTEPGTDAVTTEPGSDAGTTAPGSDAGTPTPGTDVGTTEPVNNPVPTEPSNVEQP